MGNPGGDVPDDNYSFSSGAMQVYNLAPEAVIFTNGYWQEALKLFGGLRFDGQGTAQKLFDSSPFLVIPSGGFFGKENDEILKVLLREYVKLGGTIIVFAQQHGRHIDQVVPVPEGEPLRAYGWREDQSCMFGSVFFGSIHPATSSFSKELCSVVLDGYFSAYPSTSTIILKRTSNHEPAVLMYPYGENGGHVILCALYTEWASTHGQMSVEEARFVRDLITYAWAPARTVPMFKHISGEPLSINLDAEVRNRTSVAAAKAIFKVYNPDRSILVYQFEESMALEGGGNTSVAVQLSLDLAAIDWKYGIFHLDCELYDSDNNLIQMAYERDTARFAVYTDPKPYTPTEKYLVWLTQKQDYYYWYEQAQLELHIKNLKDVPITVESFYNWGYSGQNPLPSITVPAHSEVEYPLTVDFNPLWGLDSSTFRLRYFTLFYREAGEMDYLSNTSKGVFIAYPDVGDAWVSVQESMVATSSPIQYSLQVNNRTNIVLKDTKLKLFLEKFDFFNNQYLTLETILERAEDLPNGSWTFSGTHQTAGPMAVGGYRLRLEVTKPDGSVINAVDSFSVNKSSITLGYSGPEDGFLELGKEYIFEVGVSNKYFPFSGGIDVSQGMVSLVLRSDKGEVLFQYSEPSRELKAGDHFSIIRNYTFAPTVPGLYHLLVRYEDETGTHYEIKKEYTYLNDYNLIINKNRYDYGETIQLKVRARGLGLFNLKVTCPGESFTEERQVQITPQTNYQVEENFSIATTLPNNGVISKIYVEMNEAGCLMEECKVKKDIAFLRPIYSLENESRFGEVSVKVGVPIDFLGNILHRYGFIVPIHGDVRFACPELGFDYSGTHVINPTGDNPFAIQVPIPATVMEGYYRFKFDLSVAGKEQISRNYTIYIPAPEFRYPVFYPTANSGEPISVSFKNLGGKDGNFNLRLQLFDQKSNEVMDSSQVIPIPAKEALSLDILIPSGLKSGTYNLFGMATEAQVNRTWADFNSLVVRGIEAELNSFTLKKEFLDRENVEGESEITAGSTAIESAELNAKIIRYLQSKGVDEIKPGEYGQYNDAWATAFTSGNTIYFSASLSNGLESSKDTLCVYDFSTKTLQAKYGTEILVDLIFRDSQGNIWCSGPSESGYLVLKKNGNEPWQKYTQAEGMAGGAVHDMIEAPYGGGTGVWLSSDNGVSVFSSETWRSFTSADGLPAASVYALSKDDTGAVMAFTSKGVAKYNGTVFESLVTPFANVNYWDHSIVATTSEGAWIVANNSLYLFRTGIWTQWAIKDIVGNYSSVWARKIESGDDRLWISGSYRDVDNTSYYYLTCRTGSAFAVYSEKDFPSIGTFRGICQGSGECFASPFGYFKFQDGQFIHKVIDVDSNKLFAEISDIVADNKGNIWAACGGGFSVYDGSSWINYCDTKDHFAFLNMEILAVGPDDAMYGFGNAYGSYKRIVKIKDGVVDFIDTPTLSVLLNYRTHIVVDKTGRIWVGENNLYYYDGAWHDFSGIRFIYAMASDGAGGVWVAPAPWDYGNVYHLFHIKSDLTVDDYSEANSGLRGQDISKLLVDASGKLWIGYGQTHSYGVYRIEKLDGFDGTQWIDCTGYEGYPDNTICGIVSDGAGRLLAVDGDRKLFSLTGAKFDVIHEDVKFNKCLTFSNGRLYCVGGESSSGGGGAEIAASGEGGVSSSSNFVKINFSSGLTEEEVWQQTFPVNIASGEKVYVDLLTGKTLETGTYVLKTKLLSSLNQQLAKSDYDFSVVGEGLSVMLARTEQGEPYVKAGSEIGTKVKIINDSADEYSDLVYTLKKELPSGSVETIKSETISLAAGDIYEDAYTFTESDIGTWKLITEIGLPDGSGGIEVLSSSEVLFEVAEPQIEYEAVLPEYSGDEPFAIKLKLANKGKIAAQIQAVVSGSDPIIDEAVTLEPGEERILSATTTITADHVYDITFNGDLEKSEQKTVAYGYKEALSFNVLPSYREGTVEIGFSIVNSGSLAFQETLHAELYTIGNTVPLYVYDRTYNLFPQTGAIADSFAMNFVPGAYELRYRTGRNPVVQAIPINVVQSGIGQLIFSPQPKYVLGRTGFSYTLSNQDTVAAEIPVTFTIMDSANAQIFTVNRSHYLGAGESETVTYSFNFEQPGNYIVVISGEKLASGPVQSAIRILKGEDVAATATIQEIMGDRIPVLINVDNKGFYDFQGSLIINSENSRYEEALSVTSEASLNRVFNFASTRLTPGTHDIKVYVIDSVGEEIAQVSQSISIKSADIKISETPENLEISAGSFEKTSIKVKNEGNIKGIARLQVTAFDNLSFTRELYLDGGQEIEVADVVINAASDIPTGNYSCVYKLSGNGVIGGVQSGSFTFKVVGVGLTVDAALDKTVYHVGDTTRLTLSISAPNPLMLPLEIVCNWGDFHETRQFSLESGSSSQVFDIPIDAIREGKIFFGIYHLEGRGIYLNDLYINVADAVSVTLDKQVYAPGDVIDALFQVNEPGVLEVACFNDNQTISIGSEATYTSTIPIGTLGGSHGVSWSFTPTDTASEARSGSKLFDVSGLVVKTVSAVVEKPKYANGEAIKSMLEFESNQDVSLTLRTWIALPSGSSYYAGERSISLSKDKQTSVINETSFQTDQAGSHKLVYGLYLNEHDVIVGSMAFACGDAVLLGVSTDRSEYPNGNEEVRVRVDHFGEGTANLQLFLDDVKVADRSVTLAGVGYTEILLTGAEVGGGSHHLQAIMSKDNLTSTKDSSFTYGTNLPDLQVNLADQAVDGLNYTYKIRVTNEGKTSAPASLLMFSVDGASVNGVNVGSLEPGAFQEFDFAWSGSGKAGEHVLLFAADDGNAVKEYSEANNEYSINLSVPALFYKLEVQPTVLTANMTATIYTRLINNNADSATYLLHMTLTHNASGQVVFERDKTVNLGGFAHTVETDLFETGINPAGDYTLLQTLTSGDTNLSEELLVIIETTQALTGTVELVPNAIKANLETAVNVKMNLVNAGNVALQDEPLTIDVINKDTQENVKSDSLLVSLNLAEQKLYEKSLAINVSTGAYIFQVKYLDKVIAEAELAAIEGLEKQKAISAKPRVLLLNALSLPYLAPKTHLKTILQSAGVEFRDTDQILDSWVQSQRGEQTINVVFGNLLSPVLKAELAERVLRGEGLILYWTGMSADQGLEDVAGVSMKTMPFPQQEKDITVLPSVLGAGGSFTLPSKTKYWLEASAADVATIAETKNGQKPVMTYRPYGAGKVITIAVSLEKASNQELARRLLLTAVALLNRPEIFAISDLSRVVPIQFTLKNSLGEDKSYLVKEIIPQGVVGYGYDPSPDAGEELKWTLSIPSGNEKGAFYWAKLPNQIGTFDLKTEIYEASVGANHDSPIDQVSLQFEVTSTVVSRIDEIVAELEQLTAAGEDQGRIHQAVSRLESVRSRTGDDILSLYLDMVDCAKAGKALREVEAVDVSSLRLKVVNVLMAYARLFYDKAVTIPPISLAPFALRLQE